MPKTAKEVYEEMKITGEYRPREMNLKVMERMIDIASDNIKFMDSLIAKNMINWRIIFLAYYDALRELCEVLIRLDGFKISNHQGCFAYICIKFPVLKFEWNFFEKVRLMRNGTYYEGKSITETDWKSINIQLKLYINTLQAEVKKKMEKSR